MLMAMEKVGLRAQGLGQDHRSALQTGFLHRSKESMEHICYREIMNRYDRTFSFMFMTHVQVMHLSIWLAIIKYAGKTAPPAVVPESLQKSVWTDYAFRNS